MLGPSIDVSPLLQVAAALVNNAQPAQRRIRTLIENQRNDATSRHLTAREEFFPNEASSLSPPRVSLVAPTTARDSRCGPSKSVAFPPPLLQHQQEGVRWLLALRQLGLHGILADEMGLGKTIQVIAFFAALAARGELGTYLVVAPLSTLDNWRRELSRWLPWMHVTLFRGSRGQRANLRSQLRRRHRRAFQRRDVLQAQWENGVPSTTLAKEVGGVVLTSYEAVMQDSGALARLLSWDVTVVDEAHRLKNMECKLLRTLRKAACAMRLILTGTPLQNNLEELWTLLEYVSPQLFRHGDAAQREARAAIAKFSEMTKGEAAERSGSADSIPASHNSPCKGRVAADGDDWKSTSSTFEDSGDEESFLAASLPADSSLRQQQQQLVLHLKTALQPFLLRRTKTTAGIRLPPRCDVFLPTPLTPTQRAFYERVKQNERYAASRLTHLRKCCIHPFLFPEFCDEVYDSLAAHSVPDEATPAQKLDALLSNSGKLQLLDTVLPLLRQRGHRVLLFSQMTRALDIVEDYLTLKNQIVEEAFWKSYTGGEDSGDNPDAVKAEHGVSHLWSRLLPYTRLDGMSTDQERGEAIRLFQAAGGVEDQRHVVSDVLTGLQQCSGVEDCDEGPSAVVGEDKVVSNTSHTARGRKRPRAHSTQSFLRGVTEDDAIFEDPASTICSFLSPPVQTPTPRVLAEKVLNETSSSAAFKPTGSVKSCYTNLVKRQTGDATHASTLQKEGSPSALMTGWTSDDTACRGLSQTSFEPAGSTSPTPSPQLFLFLISTRAGGTGLNLTAADTVILLDGDFNPHNDMQAIDRCHRIGQTKTVAVYRLLSPATVEDQQQLLIAAKKMELDRLVLDDAQGQGEMGGRRPTHAAELLDTAEDLHLNSSRKSSRNAAGNAGATEGLTPSQLELLLDRTWLREACSLVRELPKFQR
jgi:SNF2 family DNA or RNA helicase